MSVRGSSVWLGMWGSCRCAGGWGMRAAWGGQVSCQWGMWAVGEDALCMFLPHQAMGRGGCSGEWELCGGGALCVCVPHPTVGLCGGRALCPPTSPHPPAVGLWVCSRLSQHRPGPGDAA